MPAGLVNIPDVPLPRGSGGEKYQISLLQQVKAMIDILFDDFSKYFAGPKPWFHIRALSRLMANFT